jgi:hypothetical protein
MSKFMKSAVHRYGDESTGSCLSSGLFSPDVLNNPVSWFTGVPLAFSLLGVLSFVPLAGLESHFFCLRGLAPETPYIRTLNHAP